MNKQRGQASLYAVGALLITCLGLYAWAQTERASRIGAEAKAKALSTALEQQSLTVNGLINLTNKNAETIREQGERNNATYQDTLAMSNELNKLRLTEEYKALEKPYDRGIANDDRRRRILQRFSGDQDDPRGDETTDPSSTPPP